jgi:hypothetical protein
LTTPPLHQDADLIMDIPHRIAAQISAVLRSAGPYGRRIALTAIGAGCAAGLGVTLAIAVQLPSDMKEPIQAQEQTLAQSELPLEAQARANALGNPPALNAPISQSADISVPPDTMVQTTAADLDEKPTGPTSTTNTIGDDAPATPPVARAPTPGPTSDDGKTG